MRHSIPAPNDLNNDQKGFLGEHTLLFYVQRLGGADDAMPLALVARRHDGKAIDVKAYIHRADALNDLGRS